MHEAAGLSHEQIAEMYGVTRQAVTKRFGDMGEYRRAQFQDVNALLPWDVAHHPLKHKLKQQSGYLGLRAFLRKQLGQTLSPRSQAAMRRFLAHVEAGEVLDLDEIQGAHFVKTDQMRDGSLVVRWPLGVPKDERSELFRYVPGQGEAATG
ncbi:hypothetical protein [Streptomyces pseudogriseolus]|uniref:hypothetical protein n=1 Tax=Streptomyces pseudogriseolus TaxID=36817 RepID=UPI003FA286F5